MTRAPAAAALVVAIVLAGCTTAAHRTATPPRTLSAGAPTATASTATAASTPTSTPASSATAACPAGYAAPAPTRPVIALGFMLSPDLSTVTGTEHVVFTPDLPIHELVFRLTANTRTGVAHGTSIQVTSASADHGAGPMQFTAANAAAGTQGGLLHLPFARVVAAGSTVTADIAFRLKLGAGTFDRYGLAGGFAWFGSGQPLLAWQNGYGWHTEDLLDFVAESATSEAADTALQVSAPAADTVIMSGDPTQPTTSGGQRIWQAHLDAARDVSVAVGPFAVRDVRVGSVRLRVAAYSADERDRLVPEFVRAITDLSARFGPFPFPSLSVARLAGDFGGIEYPSSILMLSGTRLVAVHETAHQWFYAMLGDSQAQHPFLDEAFAQYAEELVDGDLAGSMPLQVAGAVDRSTESYGENSNSYYYITYTKGAAALEAARAAGPPARWDQALRCYVNRNSWRIVTPADLQQALATLPASLGVLRRAGALP